MKLIFILSVLILSTLSLLVEARSKRTDPSLSFTSATVSGVCNRNLANGMFVDNGYTYTVDSTLACASGSSSTVAKGSFAVSSNNLPSFTVKAYANAGDETPQFSSTLVFYEAFEYNYNGGPAGGYNPNVHAIVAGTTQSFFNTTEHQFLVPTMTTSVISGNTGKNVTSFMFSSANTLFSTMSITFYADIVTAPCSYGPSGIVIKPNSIKITAWLDSYNFLGGNSNGFAIMAYIITQKPLQTVTTDSSGMMDVNIGVSTDKAGGSFGWDTEAYTSSIPSDTTLQTIFASSFQVGSFNATSQPGTAQQIFFSYNATSTELLTLIWDPTVAYDESSSASSLQISMALILMAIMRILL